jgi:Secretion system C-terminal sorting domain/Family of unknown function (DUF3836)
MKKITLVMLIVFTITAQGQNKLLSSAYEFYDSFENTWKKNYGSNYKYDNNNNLIEEQDFYFNVNGSWENNGKTTYTYNVNNKVTEYFEYAWNEKTNQYDVDEKAIYTYVNNKLAGIEFFEFIDSVWESYGRYTITYNNNLPTVLTERFLENGQWYDSRTTYTYNANNRVISEVEEKLVGALWVNNRKSLYTYNANNKLTIVKGADWDEFNNNWKADTQNAYEYVLDAQGNRISSKESGYEQNYTYDTFAMMSSFAHPFKDKTGLDYFTEDFPYVNKLLYETTNSGTGRTTYNYNSLITLGNEAREIVNKGITFYPNPTQDFINIQNESNTVTDRAIVTDMTGKVLQQFQNTNKIDVRSLPKGMYFIQIFLREKKWQSKFLKE